MGFNPVVHDFHHKGTKTQRMHRFYLDGSGEGRKTLDFRPGM
ncbi:MAG: hypothetical protein PHF80_03930 [Methanothrix sp.]|nr:hypothetical protein [Methanothrix sp.]